MNSTPLVRQYEYEIIDMLRLCRYKIIGFHEYPSPSWNGEEYPGAKFRRLVLYFKFFELV